MMIIDVVRRHAHPPRFYEQLVLKASIAFDVDVAGIISFAPAVSVGTGRLL